MQHTAKYLIHADVRTSGVVERSDVVGAIFGQTEGLLGEELDLRDLQDSSKVGRIHVEIESDEGRSYGSITIASGLDRVETAVLAAALETMERVGPCKADCTVTNIEDARAAKRRAVVDRASELLTEFEEEVLAGDRLVDEVRKRARVAEITEYSGLPAGPRVGNSDAIIIVEGRSDVRQLLEHGIRNAIAVEGTDVPEPVAALSLERKTTAFLDGDRGGDLILRELEQVGEIDYVAFAPTDKSVEELNRGEILNALRKKIPYEQIADGASAREAFNPTDGGTVSIPDDDETAQHSDGDSGSEPTVDSPDVSLAGAEISSETGQSTHSTVADESSVVDTHGDSDLQEPESTTAPSGNQLDAAEQADEASERETGTEPQTLTGHVSAVCANGSNAARFLDSEFSILEEHDVDDAFERLCEAEPVPETVVIDGKLSQQLLDVAAQRGVSQLVGTETGEFVKQPTSIRIRTASEFEVTA